MAVGTAAICIEFLDKSDEELRHLASWLRDEDELRGRVELTHAPLQPGEMGGTLEAVSVMVTSGTAAVLVRSLFNWLGRQREAKIVKLTLNTKTGKIDLTGGSADNAEQVLEACRKILDGD